MSGRSRSRAPPITPASPTGLAASAITSISGLQLIDLVVDRRERSRRFERRRTTSRRSRKPVEVVGVQRLPALEHDVVGHVDDIADRPDADRLQPLAQPPGALAHLHARDHPRGEPRAKGVVFDGDSRPGLDRLARGRRPRVGDAADPCQKERRSPARRPGVPGSPGGCSSPPGRWRCRRRRPRSTRGSSPVRASRSVKASTGMSSRR